MRNKRGIITIVVIAIIILIAGATYAALQPDINVTNARYVVETGTYSIDYVKGNHITDIPDVMNATTENTANILVKAKTNATASTAYLGLYLNTLPETDMEIVNAGVINIAACTNNTCTSFSRPVVLASSEKKLIIDNIPLTDSWTEVNIYFWLDGYVEMNSLINKSYSGYVSAEATIIQD